MPNIVYFTRLPVQVDPFLLQDEISPYVDNGWVNHVNSHCYDGTWDVLPLRTLQENANSHPILQSFSLEREGDWVYLPIVDSLPQIKLILDWFQCDLEAVRLMRLKPGTHIKPHQDKGLAMEYGYARFHLPIYAAEHVEFKVNDSFVPMKNGQLWYLNADASHSVRHIGSQDRINLVIDCKVNDWLIKQINDVQITPEE